MTDPALQADLFGMTPKPKVPKARAQKAKAQEEAHAPVEAAPVAAAPAPEPLAAAASLSPAELEELVALLDDDALAQLTLAAVRQMKRRLARGRRGTPPAPSLNRAFKQLAAELGGSQGSE